ncbi:MAG: hypothetical protein IJJ69_13700, partial [Oscillospiraceae bacterium]|nr:hypothetical protein [Oscillospiraceae bacterium]
MRKERDAEPGFAALHGTIGICENRSDENARQTLLFNYLTVSCVISGKETCNHRGGRAFMKKLSVIE